MSHRPIKVVAMAVALSALAACGGGGDDVDAADATAASTSAPASPDTAAGSTTTGSPDEGADTGADEADDELDELLDEAAQRSYYIEYETRNPDGATSRFVMAQDPPNRLVGSLDSPLVVVDDKAYSCETDAGVRTCRELPPTLAESLTSAPALGLLGMGPALAREAAGSNLVRRTTDETIAGRPARCYLFDASKLAGVSEGDFTFCIDRETSVTLRILLGDDQSIEAVVVRDPTPDDFRVDA